MMRSMFTAVSGLKNHQTRMDVIGNNIANVNTVAFKAGRVNFQDILNQTISGARTPQAGGRGGVNPKQVGLGMTIGAIDTIFTPGGLQTTDNPTDFAIEGDGFFIVGDGTQQFYTRDGAFKLSADGALVNANGLRVQGWMAGDGGNIDVTGGLSNIVLPLTTQMEPQATGDLQFDGNLDANFAMGDSWNTRAEIFDSLGNLHDIPVIFTKSANNTWHWEAFDPADNVTSIGSGSTTFATNGIFDSVTGAQISFNPGGGAAEPLEVLLNFENLTQFSGAPTAHVSFQDGYPAGDLDMVTTDSAGMITGIFTNGQSSALAQLAMANFVNPGGLLKAGGNLYQISNNSGTANVGTANSGGRGSIAVGALEMSNVDLAQEFTSMITTQRGFQANSRVITTSDEMLQELLTLKR
ncbi:MAG TPA: flagellar hook protein FlgE [Atribacteraceae bacterium]|nr:flagellar hook protein FlgE [Atribacteraceae bacterium]